MSARFGETDSIFLPLPGFNLDEMSTALTEFIMAVGIDISRILSSTLGRMEYQTSVVDRVEAFAIDTEQCVAKI